MAGFEDGQIDLVDTSTNTVVLQAPSGGQNPMGLFLSRPSRHPQLPGDGAERPDGTTVTETLSWLDGDNFDIAVLVVSLSLPDGSGARLQNPRVEPGSSPTAPA